MGTSLSNAAVSIRPDGDVFEIDPREWASTMRELRAVRPLASFLVLRQAGALRIIRSHASKHGHFALQQGASLECTRCGASCTVDLDDMIARGDLVRPERCGDAP